MAHKSFNVRLIILISVLIVSFLSIIPLQASATSLPTNGLVALWDGSTIDSAGIYDGINYGMTTGQLSNGQTIMLFDGATDYIDCGTDTALNLGAQDYAIEALVRPHGLTGLQAIAGKNTFSTNGWGLYMNGQTFVYTSRGTDSGQGVTSTNVTAENWYHVVANRESNSIYLYVNGVNQTGAKTITINPSTANTKFIIGKRVTAASYFANCDIAYIAVYNRSIRSEIDQHYTISQRVIDLSTESIIHGDVYGRDSMPSYMNGGVGVVDGKITLYNNRYNPLVQIDAPVYQDKDGAKSIAGLSSSSLSSSGPSYKSFVTNGTVNAEYTGTNRNIDTTVNFGESKILVSNSIEYTGITNSVYDGVNITTTPGYSEFVSSGKTIAPISGDILGVYSNNALYQSIFTFYANGTKNYTNWNTIPAGTTKTNNAALFTSEEPAIVMTAPNGYLSTFTFSEHTDLVTIPAISAVLYGSYDTGAPGYGEKGFIGHHINTTWSTWAEGGSQMGFATNATYKQYIDALYNNGSEITPHNIGDNGVGSTRAKVEKYGPYYQTNYSTRNWIDHSLSDGTRNDGIRSLGLDATNETYYIGDLLSLYGYKYSWAYLDVDDSLYNINQANITKWAGLPMNLVYENTNVHLSNGDKLWQWTSVAPTHTTYIDYYNNSSIDALIDAYGTTDWHGYFAYENRATVPYYHNDDYTINATFDGILSHIADKKQSGDLWNPTVSDWADYQRQLYNVTVTPAGTRTYTIVNNNPTTVNGFSMRVSGAATPRMDGVAMSTKTHGSDTIFWTNLPTGTHMLVI